MKANPHRTSHEVPQGRFAARRLSIVTAVAGTLLLGVVTAIAVVPTYDPFPYTQESVLERLGPQWVEAPSHGDLPYVFDERIQPGDTIQAIFRRLGVNDTEITSFLASDADGKDALRKLRAGRSVVVTLSPAGRVLTLGLPLGSSAERLVIERAADGQLSKSLSGEADTSTLVEMRSGTITHSLFGATDAAGVPDSVASKFAEIFGTQIDFTRDLRQGDHFSVVYETVFDQGVPVQTGRILAAEFINQGKKHTVVRFTESDGNEAYYTPDGRGLNQAFLRYPLEFTRISSSFGRRLHPIHRSWRSHNGTDFAAPSGTPIKASSDGVVKFIGTQRGYGNTVIIEHRGNYSSLYAHMNGFAGSVTKGKRIRQGDVIGYVGMTGWATGPHLHYEIRVNDVPHDPMKIALPTVMPLDAKALVAFKGVTEPLLDRLALLNYAADSALAQGTE